MSPEDDDDERFLRDLDDADAWLRRLIRSVARLGRWPHERWSLGFVQGVEPAGPTAVQVPVRREHQSPLPEKDLEVTKA